MPAAIESIVQRRGTDVDEHESDIGTGVHKETERSQARWEQKLSILTPLHPTLPEGDVS